MAEEPQHWPTERMITDGHAEYATREDVDALPTDLLVDVAELCEVDEFAPDECIPCYAYVLYLEQQKNAKVEELQQELLEMTPSAPEEEYETPRLDALVQETPTWEPVPAVDVAEQFAAKVKELDNLVDELLNGPPIPPPNVSLTELGLLVVAASRWIRITEAQGVELAHDQQLMLDETKALVSRLRHE